MEGRWEYRVEWQGHPGQDTWEPIQCHNIRGRADEALKKFKDSTAGAWEADGSGRASGRGRGRGRVRGRSRKVAKVQQKDQSEDDEEEDSSDEV